MHTGHFGSRTSSVPEPTHRLAPCHQLGWAAAPSVRCSSSSPLLDLEASPLAMRRGSQLPATVKYHGEHSIPPEPVLKVLSDPRYSAAPRHRSARVVLVVAAPPDARLVATLGGAVEPFVHAPDSVHPARIGGIGVVDDAVL